MFFLLSVPVEFVLRFFVSLFLFPVELVLELAVSFFFFSFFCGTWFCLASAQSFSKPTSLAVVCNGDACGPTWTHPSVEHIRFDYIEHQHPAWVLGYLCRLVKKGHRFCDRHCLESRRLLYFKPRIPHHAWWEDARDTFNVYGLPSHSLFGASHMISSRRRSWRWTAMTMKRLWVSPLLLSWTDDLLRALKTL